MGDHHCKECAHRDGDGLESIPPIQSYDKCQVRGFGYCTTLNQNGDCEFWQIHPQHVKAREREERALQVREAGHLVGQQKQYPLALYIIGTVAYLGFGAWLLLFILSIVL